MSECGECDTLKCYNITDALVRKLVHGKNVFIRTDIRINNIADAAFY